MRSNCWKTSSVKSTGYYKRSNNHEGNRDRHPDAGRHPCPGKSHRPMSNYGLVQMKREKNNVRPIAMATESRIVA
jgi:hypothetical protein